MVISSYQKSANPSRSQRKNLSRNEKSNDTTNKKATLPKAGRHEGLKIPFWRQSAGSSPAGGTRKLRIVR